MNKTELFNKYLSDPDYVGEAMAVAAREIKPEYIVKVIGTSTEIEDVGEEFLSWIRFYLDGLAEKNAKGEGNE